MPFAPELVLPAILDMHRRFGQHIYSKYGFVDAFNRTFLFDVPLRHGRYIPGFGWVASDYLGIDQGAMLAMIENHRSELVWRVMRKNPHLRRGLEQAGFSGGWLGPVSRSRPTLSKTAVLGVFAALLIAAGCERASSPEIVLRFWAMGREGEVVTALLPEFERTHPGIRVKVQQLPWTAAHEKLLTAFAGDVTPDICQLGNTWVPELVALDALEPLDRYVASSPVVDATDYFAGIWDTNRIGGKLYGVPWYVDTRLVFYRRDLLHDAGFPAPPRSWQEWTQMLAAIERSRVRIATRSCSRSTRSSRSSRSPCSRTSRSSGTMGGGAISERRLPPRAGLLSRDVPARLGAGGGQCGDLQRVERVRPRPVRLLRVGALEHRRAAAPAAGRPAAELDDGAAARA